MPIVALKLEEAAKFAVDVVTPAIELLTQSTPSRNALHVVILDPRVQYITSAELPILYEVTICEQDPEKWSSDFKAIARNKARICWRTGMSTRKVGENAPYLYMTGTLVALSVTD
ncbi:MAG: hypothetical protein ABIP54_00480 [Candidatus Andersenbacteria bacterium]